MEWEMEAPFLASLPRTAPYRVPDQYFNEISGRINQAVFLAGLAKRDHHGFNVPANYFEDLGQQIESRIAVDRLISLASGDGFKTPDHYFDQLQANIISKTSGQAKPVKVIKLWQSEAMRYISAACFIVLVASGLYLKEQHSARQLASTELANEQMLYDIDEQVIFEHLEDTQSANAAPASQTEMEDYILDHFSTNDLSNNL